MSNLGPDFERRFRQRRLHIEDVCACPWNTPYTDPPEPTGAEDCVCGEYPIFEWDADRAVRCVCPSCKRSSGRLLWGTRAYAVEAWNDKIAALRKEE